MSRTMNPCSRFALASISIIDKLVQVYKSIRPLCNIFVTLG